MPPLCGSPIVANMIELTNLEENAHIPENISAWMTWIETIRYPTQPERGLEWDTRRVMNARRVQIPCLRIETWGTRHPTELSKALLTIVERGLITRRQVKGARIP